MTLKQLEAFYWAATCGSFGIAAERLHISQSSLSKRLVELESGLGRMLFDRSSRRATLTVEGVALLPRARALLDHAGEVAASVGVEAAMRGRCRLGVGEIAASSWLPKLVTGLRSRYPDLTLEPYVDLGAELEAKLINGKLDAAMIARESNHAALDSVLIAQVEYVWVASPQTVANRRVAEDLIRELPIVTMSRQAGSTRILDIWRQESNVKGLNLIESNSMVTMAGLVSAGIGIGYLPRGWLRPLLRNRTLRIVSSRTPLRRLDYNFFWRIDDKRPLITKLRDLALEVVDYDTSLLML